MRILIDIGHPSDVHLFKNFAWHLQSRGHDILFAARDKECSVSLLKKYGFNYILLGRPSKGLLNKIKGLFFFCYKLFKIAVKFNPDLFLSHGSIYAAVVSKMMRKKNILFEDTGNLEQVLLYILFADVILSPESLKLNLGKRHIKFKSYLELAYLHPKYFKPDINILDNLGVKKGEKFVVIRFGAHAATHDFGYGGMPLKYKIKCVEEFSKYAKIFISSEMRIEKCLEKFKINIPPEKMHDVFYYASLVYSEGAKSASEASVLGTPAIYVYFKCLDYIADQKKYGTIFNFTGNICGIEESIKKGKEILNGSNTKESFRAKRNQIVADNINVTEFMVWFVENYPQSLKVAAADSSYQFNFK